MPMQLQSWFHAAQSARRAHIFALLILTSLGGQVQAAERLTDSPMPMTSDWDYRLDAQNALWLLYYADGQKLTLRDPTGVARKITPERAAAAPSGVGMAKLESSGVVSLWRSKLPSKGLYVSRSDRPISDAIEVGGDTEPSKRVEATRVGDRLALLWVGERPAEGSKAGYHLYYREMHLPDGKLTAIEHVLPGYYPVWATDERGAVIAFSWVTDEGKPRIAARTRAASADAFGDPVTVAEVPLITPIFRAFRSADRWFVIWLAQYSTMPGDFQLEGAYSDDVGATWTRFSFSELKGYDIGSLDIAADPQGHIVLAATARRRDQPEKHDVLLVRSMDRGTSWSSPERLRPTDIRTRFQARSPAVILGKEPGELLVVWEDWREIRSRLYASLSKDYGKTWLYENVSLPHDPNVNLSLSPTVSGLYQRDGRYHVIAQQALDDSLRKKYLIDIAFTQDDLKPSPPAATQPSEHGDNANQAQAASIGPGQPMSEESAADLRKRVAEFWQAMVNSNYPAAYAFYDPFYRAKVDQNRFASNLGRIHYASFQIEDVSIDAPTANIKTKVRYSIGPFKAPTTGETIVRAEQEVSVPETWVWVDGVWYRQYYSEVNDLRYTQY